MPLANWQVSAFEVRVPIAWVWNLHRDAKGDTSLDQEENTVGITRHV